MGRGWASEWEAVRSDHTWLEHSPAKRHAGVMEIEDRLKALILRLPYMAREHAAPATFWAAVDTELDAIETMASGQHAELLERYYVAIVEQADIMGLVQPE
jgi:hypothetical protein